MQAPKHSSSNYEYYIVAYCQTDGGQPTVVDIVGRIYDVSARQASSKEDSMLLFLLSLLLMMYSYTS